jgi:hypothetical protein
LGKKGERFISHFESAYISPLRFQEEPLAETFGPTQRSVQFELHIKAKTPYTQIILSDHARHAMNDPPPPIPEDDAPPGYSVTAQQPPTYNAALTTRPETFSASTLPTQHRLTGTFPTRNFHSEVLRLRGSRTIDVAFGSLGNKIWFHMQPPRFEKAMELTYDDVAADYLFPNGYLWKQGWSHSVVLLEGFNPKWARIKEFGGVHHSVEVVVRNDQVGAILVNVYIVVEKPSRLPFK